MIALLLEEVGPRPVDPRARLRTCIAIAKPDAPRTLLYRPDPLLAGLLVAPKKGWIAKRVYRLRQTVKWY